MDKNSELNNINYEPDSGDWFGEEKVALKPEPEAEENSSSSSKTDKSFPEEKAWKWSIGIACVILGIIFSLLFKVYKKEPFTPYYTNKLAEVVKNLEKERNRLQADLENARGTIKKYEDSSAKGRDETSTMQSQLEKIRQEAGFTHVTGPGVIVTLNDSTIKPKPDDDPNYYIVHDSDIMALVNELWASGAEAITINDQRVVMTTAIRCVGPTITVNTVRLTPPYVVKSIGPPAELEKGLTYPGGFLDTMAPNKDRGVSIKISRETDIKLAPFKGTLVNRYAKTYTPQPGDE